MTSFEQTANQHLADLKSAGTIIEGNIIGVREDLRTSKAIVSIPTDEGLEEKYIAIYEVGEELQWNFLKPIDRMEDLYDFIDNDTWHYPDLLKRIVAPIALVMDDIGIKMYGWFQLNNLPIISKGETVYLYCNVILPEHEAIVDGLGETVTIEDRPNE